MLRSGEKRRIYMDYASTTPVDPRVLEAMLPYFEDKFGNAASLHRWGMEAREALEEARETIASFIRASPMEVIFTSSATESNNLAIKGAAFASRSKGKHIITSRIEHPSVLEPCRWLERNGFQVTYIPVDRHGLVDPARIEKEIREDTILVSIMHANNEIGTIEPVREIGEVCREKNVIFHVDAAQSFGKIPIDVEKMNIDLLTMSGHKIYGPKGIGALYVREGVKVEPLLHGGGHEYGLRSSTVNVPGAAGFAKACELMRDLMEEESEKLRSLCRRLIEGVLEIDGVHLTGHPEKRLPTIASFWLEFIDGERLILELNERGIAASIGSACSSGRLEPSHVLLAIGLNEEQAKRGLRLSIGRWTRRDEVEYVIEALREIAGKYAK
ncbi:MAG: cysteine desulfurase [Thaumarchaeota archaeon]|nr:cysteine desulfurase [Nitrososphaerota archaeon]